MKLLVSHEGTADCAVENKKQNWRSYGNVVSRESIK